MNPDIQFIDADVVVIGSGIAGLSAALTAAEHGKRPLLISKARSGKTTNTGISGGGFTFASGAFNAQVHIEKTLDAGRMLNDPILVKQLVDHAPFETEKLVRRGLNGRYGKNGFNCRTTGFVGGPQISSLLVRSCRSAGVKFLENVMITDLMSTNQICHGVLGYQKQSGKWFGIRARATILATGGAAGLYAQTDNVPGAIGDGYALGLQAGLELIDMEFVQFYPLAYAGSGHASMILPPVFADLGRIVNSRGEDIKEKYALFEKPVAIVARDRFAQALCREISSGNGIEGALLLDLRQVDWTRSPYDDRTRELFEKKISFDSRPVKITATSHHTMGGLQIDANAQTALFGLFAAGEVTGGVHGANRMGGNALSEGVVFGGIAGSRAAAFTGKRQKASAFEAEIRARVKKRWELVGSGDRGSDLSAFMREIKKLLWERVGIIRDRTAISEGVKELDGLTAVLTKQRIETPRKLCAFMTCQNAALVSRAIALSALTRTESRGAHYREDFPVEDKQWRKRIHVRLIDGKPEVGGILPVIR